MFNSSEDLLEKQIWIRNKNQDENLVLLRHITQEDINKVEQRLNALKDIEHPSIAIPRLKQYENGEYYLEEDCHEISVRQYFTQLDTTSRLQLASRMCHLVESLFMLLPENEQFHGNIRLDCFSINHENQLMLGGLGIQKDSVPDMERLDRLIIRLFDKQEHPDTAINSFLNILRDPLPAFKRPLQLRDAIRRLLVGKNVSPHSPQKSVTSGMFLKKTLENIEERPLPVPSVDEEFELSSIDFQGLQTKQADELESINFDEDFDLTDVPELGGIQALDEEIDFDSMNIDELSAVPSKGSLDLDDFDIDEGADLLEVPSLDQSNIDSVLEMDDEIGDFDINLSSQEESLVENWNPDIPATPPPTPESSFEADPFEHDKLTSETGFGHNEQSEEVSEMEQLIENDAEDDNQRKKWIRTAMIMGSLGAIAFGWSMLNGNTEDADAQSNNKNIEAQQEKEVQKATEDSKAASDTQKLEAPKEATPAAKIKKSKKAAKSKKSDASSKNKEESSKRNNRKNETAKDSSKEKTPSLVTTKKQKKQDSVLSTSGKTKSVEPSLINTSGPSTTGTKETKAQRAKTPIKNSTPSTSPSMDTEIEETETLDIPVTPIEEEYVFDWDTTSNEAMVGTLNPKSKVRLMGITNQNPDDFLRANTILLMQAQQTGKNKDIEFILRKVSRTKEHKNNPIFIMAAAHNNLNKRKYQKSLNNLITLDEHIEQIPPQLRDALLLERAEIRALAHLAMFYKAPEDIQRFEKTIKSFESLAKVAQSQKQTDVEKFALDEVKSLENWRPVS